MNDHGIGFVIPPGQSEQDVIQVLRDHNSSRANMPVADVFRSVSRDEICAAVAEVQGLVFLPEVTQRADGDLLRQFDPLVMRRAQMIPLQMTERRITLAIANPYNMAGRDYLAQHYADHEHVFVLVTTIEVDAKIEALSSSGGVSRASLDALDAVESVSDVKDFSLADKYSDPVSETLRSIFLEGVQSSASDIHFITGAERFYYAFRINGNITGLNKVDDRLIPRIDAILLSLVNLEREHAVKLIGLSGRFSMVLASGRRIDCRYERHRAFRGYHITLRLLDKNKVEPRLGIGGLSFEDRSDKIAALEAVAAAGGSNHVEREETESDRDGRKTIMPVLTHIRRAMEMSDGITIISGPTGSGKSTTLSAILREVAKPKYIVLTLENPVEYEIPGVIHCNMRDNSEFGSYIRSFMRSDPDIILMGEVRDLDSANLAVEAAMTGHQVFTTVHTNSAAEILNRFTQLGVDRIDMARTVRLLCGQRLVKMVCKRCSQLVKLTEEQAAIYSIPTGHIGSQVRIASDRGCQDCSNGNTGRRALLEVLPVDVRVAEMIVSGASAHEIEKDIRNRYRLNNLKEQGLELLLSGESDLESVKDVINLGY